MSKMVNSVKRLNGMREFLRGKLEPWNCRAGQNSLIIRVDGSLAPCFPLYSATYDWGTVGDHRFEVGQLISTLNHKRVIRRVFKQAARSFQGVSGSFD